MTSNKSKKNKKNRKTVAKMLGANGGGVKKTVTTIVQPSTTNGTSTKKRARNARRGTRGPVSARIRNMVGTPTGLAWALANLHPCNESHTCAVGYPDGMKVPTHSTRVQRITTLSYPGDRTKNDQWDCYIIQSPWAEYAAFVCFTDVGVAPNSFDEYSYMNEWKFRNFDDTTSFSTNQWYYVPFTQFATNKTSNPGATQSKIRTEYTQIRIVAKGATSYLNASRLDDGGRLTAGSFACSARYSDTFDESKWAIDYPKLLAKIKKDLNIKAADFIDKVDRHAHTFDHTHTLNPSKTEVEILPGEGKQGVSGKTDALPLCQGGRLPPGGAAAYPDTMTSPAAWLSPLVSGKRRDCSKNDPQKAYLVEKKPMELFSDKCEDCAKTITRDQVDMPMDPGVDQVGLRPLIEGKFGAASSDLADWQASSPPSTEDLIFQGDSKAVTWEARKGCYQVQRIVNFGMENVNQGALSFYNLHYQGDGTNCAVDAEHAPVVTTPGTGTWAVQVYKGVSTKSGITLKVVQYAEGVVNPAGPYANLSPQLVDPDPTVIEVVDEEQRRLHHAYPARYNDLSEILGSIFKVAKDVGGVAKGVADGLSNVPVIGEFAKTVRNLLGGLGI
nr:MAG: capsid protein [Spider astrovirus]